MFLVAVGFWNFLGAGVFGFLMNLPVVSYYQIGTALTANHGHAAIMGVYGLLAVGLTMFAFRYVIPPDKWPEKLARISFSCMNIGLAWSQIRRRYVSGGSSGGSSGANFQLSGLFGEYTTGSSWPTVGQRSMLTTIR
ncbi:Nitric oxide reductase subunit B [Mycobacterium simulans]|uniref:Nitric oxide reductase subunit B n=1 Tax=Mycobacterium simulans TaxID=627089 RepID=A0A7Z7N9M0_9MYCO|nr:Nitric oxide reductase subunit B [Mycobacterium simulans]